MIMTKLSDAELLKRVKNLAQNNSKSGTAKELNMSVQTFTNRLLSATSSLREIPPQFHKKISQQKAKNKKIHSDIIRNVGQAGKALRIIIPQDFFTLLKWEAGDKIQLRRSGKNKIMIEKVNPSTK